MFGKLRQELPSAIKSCFSKICVRKFQLIEFEISSNLASIQYDTDHPLSLNRLAKSEHGKNTGITHGKESRNQVNTFCSKIPSILGLCRLGLKVSTLALLLSLVLVSGVKSNTLTVTWDAEYDGNISVNGDSVTPAYLVGRINNEHADGGSLQLNTIKLNGNVVGSPSSAAIPGHHIEDFV